MMKLSNGMLILSSVGHAVLFSLALSGAARLLGALSGEPISADLANIIFVVSVLITAPIAGYFKIARIFLAGSSGPVNSKVGK